MNELNYINTTPVSTLGEISKYTNTKGIFLLKPRSVFDKIERQFNHPMDINLQVPSSDIGSLTMLEAVILSAFLKMTKPLAVFEFGTFLGYSTSIFVKNTESNSKIYSIDLDSTVNQVPVAENFTKEEILTNDIKNDKHLTQVQASKGEYYLRTLTDPFKSKLKLLKGDSTTFDYSNYKNKIDFIFVDGGHDYETIEKDTLHAMEMLSDSGIIFWHDFNSNIHRDVTDYLLIKSKEVPLYHIQHTMLAFYIKGDWNKLILS